jgi:hypothetical protein
VIPAEQDDKGKLAAGLSRLIDFMTSGEFDLSQRDAGKS